jgi:hypothetical protein
MNTKKAIGVVTAVAVSVFLGGVTLAQTHPGRPATNGYACAGAEIGSWMVGPFNTAQITQKKASEIAQRYANTYLKGFTVQNVSAFSGMMGMMMYSVDLNGPANEVRTLYVNPWGVVMPYGGPGRHFDE